MIHIGQGYDAHRLAEGRRLILGGVEIPYERGLLGHSDADVLTHAVIDALFGAAALGNIGQHFPDSDAKYAGADSVLLLKRTVKVLADAGWRVINIDSTIVAQAPRLGPYLDSMRRRLADVLEIPIVAVSVKAKTEECMGFTGSGEGMTAQAVCLIESI